MNNYQLTIDNAQLLEGYKQTEVGIIPEDWISPSWSSREDSYDG